MEEIKKYYNFTDNRSLWLAIGICLNDIGEKDIIAMIESNHTNKKFELDGLLIIACWKGTEKLVKRLLELGADKNVRSLIGTQPIMFVAERDMLELVEHFVKIGADMFCRTKEGKRHCVHGYAQPKVENYLVNTLPELIKNGYESVEKQKVLTEKIKELEDKLEKRTLLTPADSLDDKLKEINTNLAISDKKVSEKINEQLRTQGKGDMSELFTVRDKIIKDLTEKNISLTNSLLLLEDKLEKRTLLTPAYSLDDKLKEINTNLAISDKKVYEKINEGLRTHGKGDMSEMFTVRDNIIKDLAENNISLTNSLLLLEDKLKFYTDKKVLLEIKIKDLENKLQQQTKSQVISSLQQSIIDLENQMKITSHLSSSGKSNEN